MTTTKRAYKLQEFVAHASNVNCLKIGRKTSRILATGGEDHKVNLWSIGKPNAILSLLGHSSPVESVNFDPSEVLVAAGAASGTIKLWELEEAKIVRTLTGHRSNCTAVDFHPFGEFFASGSLDTNLKIWDIRRKGCIHTYKGHTRGVNALRFTPDGRWVVSGGEDNTVKIWDLTAGKLLHDFKHHDGQVQCIDFHPHEFLLATGSADKTVNFWDLETFELIGSAGPETTGIRSMTFNPDGRTLLCGLQESLRIFSWEPIRCHDVVDVGWSRLSDLNIHEGKLLGCSYNQSCVGVWVVDISQVEPYGRSNGHSEPKSSFSGNLTMQAENNMKTSMGRISLLGNSDGGTQESKHSVSTGSLPGTPRRVGQHPSVKMSSTSTSAASNAGTLKRSSVKAQTMSNIQSSKFDNVPVIVPRTGPRIEPAANSSLFTPMHQTLNSGKESGYGRVMPSRSRSTEFKKQTSNSDDSENESTTSSQYGSRGFRRSDSNETTDQDFPSTNGMKQPLVSSEGNIVDLKNIRNKKMLPTPPTETPTNYQYEHCEIRVPKPRKSHHDEVQKGGRIKSIVSSWNKREQSSAPASLKSSGKAMVDHSLPFQKNVATSLLLGIFYLLGRYAIHCTWVTSEAYSSPSIVLSARGSHGGRVIFDDYREAYFWLRQNTPPDAKVMSWWDYGYQITAMGNRTVIVDNNTWNNTHIATVGRAMSSYEDEAYDIMLSLDVNYVLVVFGGVTGYSSDDINKFLWMVRIGGGVFPIIKESDYLVNGEYRVDKGASPKMLNCLMYKLCYYRFGQLMTEYGKPSGYDRARSVEIGNKEVELTHLEEAFTTSNWIVRIYKVKPLNNRY